MHVTSEYGHREEINGEVDNDNDEGKLPFTELTRHRDDLDVNFKRIIVMYSGTRHPYIFLHTLDGRVVKEKEIENQRLKINISHLYS